jgi:hypothetical protein
MSIVVLLGIMVLGGAFLVFLVDMPIDEPIQSVFFMAILLLAGTIFTSTSFAALGDHRKAIPWLTLPATHFEKYLVAWLYTVLIFLLVYTALFYGVVAIAINIRTFPGHKPRMLNIFQPPIIWIFPLYTFLHGIAFLGAIYFKRIHFIKTAFAFFIFFAVLVFFNHVTLDLLLDKPVAAAPPFGGVRLYNNGSYQDLSIARHVQDNIMFGLLTGLTVTFWVAAFYRLKEKQA